MGGQGSGRLPGIKALIESDKPDLVNTGESLVLPNYSGIKEAAKKGNATSFLQAGDNVSSLVNDAGYITSSSGGVDFTTEDKKGSDCAGSDGDIGRTLTLTNTKTLKTGFCLIFRSGAFVSPADWSKTNTGTNEVITFSGINIFDEDEIIIVYGT